jgi:hypothetical protein
MPNDEPAHLSTEQRQARQEGQKLLYDSIKHLTTLSTGSVLILATFLEKFFKEPEWKALMVLAFVGFIASMLFSFATMLALSKSIFSLEEKTESGSRSGAIFLRLSILSFLIGIISLVSFSLKNFY